MPIVQSSFQTPNTVSLQRVTETLSRDATETLAGPYSVLLDEGRVSILVFCQFINFIFFKLQASATPFCRLSTPPPNLSQLYFLARQNGHPRQRWKQFGVASFVAGKGCQSGQTGWFQPFMYTHFIYPPNYIRTILYVCLGLIFIIGITTYALSSGWFPMSKFRTLLQKFN